MKNDVIKLKSKIILLIAEKTWEKLLHTCCSILGVVARPPRQVDGLGQLNTCCLASNCNMRCYMPLDSDVTGVRTARGGLKNCCSLLIIIFITLIDESMTVSTLHLAIGDVYF